MKLIRDRAAGEGDRTRRLTVKQYDAGLRERLSEAAAATLAAEDQYDVLTALAEAQEVLAALAIHHALTEGEVADRAAEIRQQLGGFRERVGLIQ